MAEWVVNCHSVLRDNEVLRDVSIWSAEDRAANPNAYYTIEVGIGSGDGKFDRLGIYDGSEDALEGNATRSLIAQTGVPRRLREGDTLQINVASAGSPDLTTAGLTVEWTLALASGNSQAEKPLFTTAGFLPDARVRAAVEGLTQRLNTSGVTEWSIAIPLQDPAGVVGLGDYADMVFQGRLQRDSSTQISLQRYTGNVCVVNGSEVVIGSSGLTLTTSDYLIDANGLSTGAAPAAAATTYGVYLLGPGAAYSPNTLKMCSTAVVSAPSMTANGLYLGTTGNALECRFVGWVRVNATPNFVNDTTDRWVINYYNRRPLPILLTPGYADGNTATTYTTTSTTWTAANGGTGATGSYIANGEDAVSFHAHGGISNSGAAAYSYIGIGDNSTSAAWSQSAHAGTTADAVTCSMTQTPAAGYRTVSLLVRVSATTGTYYVDDVRAGSSTDPYVTYLNGWVMG